MTAQSRAVQSRDQKEVIEMVMGLEMEEKVRNGNKMGNGMERDGMENRIRQGQGQG